MTREQAKREVDLLDFYLQNHTDDYGEQSHTAMMMAIKALEQKPCEDAISRHAVEDKLLKLCNELEGIFANIRMKNQDESVCGLCEYDCPAPYECPGFDNEDCFKLADEIRHNWQSTKDLPSVNPQHTDVEIQKMQELEQVEIQKAYELGKTEGQKSEDAISRAEAMTEIMMFAGNVKSDEEDIYIKVSDAVQLLRELPSVNPQPKTGHWEKMVEVYDLQQNRMLVPYGYDDAKFGNTPVYVCNCGCESNKNSRFCPDCGCAMKGESE